MKNLKGRQYQTGGHGFYHAPEGTIFHVMENATKNVIGSFNNRTDAKNLMIDVQQSGYHSVIAEAPGHELLCLLEQL